MLFPFLVIERIIFQTALNIEYSSRNLKRQRDIGMLKLEL